jgi:hypothetical protein
MKRLQRGLIVAIMVAAIPVMAVVAATVALFASALWSGAQAAPPSQEPPTPVTVEASAVQLASLIMTPTIGTTSGSCATSNTAYLRVGAPVYYCFTVRNTGDEALTLLRVRTSLGMDQALSSATVQPGGTTSLFAPNLTDNTTQDVTSYITLTAQSQVSSAQFESFGRVRVEYVTPQVNVVKYVGLDRNSCGSSRTLRIPSGQNASFCISIQNTGDVTFTNHTIADPPLSINATINYVLAPGATLNIFPSNMTSLGINNGSLERTNVQSAFANTVNYTGRGPNDITVTGNSTATIEIGNTTVRMTKTVSTAPEDCTKTNAITVPPGTRVYYCVIIQNTGTVTLTQHELTEAYTAIYLKFSHPLAPGGTLNVTNDFLARNNLPIVFGPFEVHPKYGTQFNVIGDTMTYRGVTADGISTSLTSRATVTYPPTPTITFTPRPDPTSTSTPPFPPTPTPTFTPATPTPTVTPTFTPITPSPTPTRSYAISLLQTPTPRSQLAAVPGAPIQDPSQQIPGQPTIDPNLPPQQPPVQDPILATATQIAIDATSTAIAVVATASQLEIENAQATALAESQAAIPTPLSPDSPLPTPAVEPATLPGGATQTDTMPIVTATPSAEITVLPPLVTAEVAPEETVIETPVIVVLVVTNTPLPGQEPTQENGLPAGQRPIVYPTPTPTPDFVMAAARTFDVAVTTMGWLWFLVGSLIFFVTAGIVAGLFFRQSEARRYDLPEPEYWLEEEPPQNPDSAQARTSSKSSTTGRSDEEWPADLP